MEPIGGYFQWGFPTRANRCLHEGAVYLNSGRHALEYILRGIPNVKCLWIPYFTCDAVLLPLQKLGIPWKFYHINDKLEIAEKQELDEGDFLLYTNYYGIKDSYCRQIAETYGEHLILDNAQALFCAPIKTAHQFYSPRKYIGMPDGGLAVTSIADSCKNLPVDLSYDRCAHLLKRLELAPSEGYNDFKETSKKISAAPLSQMSAISRHIFETVDLDAVKQRRRENFEYIHSALASSNRLEIPSTDSFECPLIYPYWSDRTDLKKKLIENSVFVATYWPNVFEWTSPKDLEHEIADHVICLPIDQRYGKEQMERMVGLIQSPAKE